MWSFYRSRYYQRSNHGVLIMKRRMSKSVPIMATVPSVILMAATLAACDDKPQIPSDFTTVAACERYYGQGNCDEQQGANQTPASTRTTPGGTPAPSQQAHGGSSGGGGSNSFIMIPGPGGTYVPAPSSGFTGTTTPTTRTFAPRAGTPPLPAYSGATVAPRSSTVGSGSTIGSTGTVARGGMGTTAAGSSGG